MPETLRASCVIADSSDSDSCVFVAIRARRWPTRRCTTTRKGSSTSAMIVSCQLSSSIATNAASTVTVLPTTLETVFESTFETPPTSFASRDWITPVRVRVKKPSSICCRREKSLHAQRRGHPVADGGGQVGLPDAEPLRDRPDEHDPERRSP